MDAEQDNKPMMATDTPQLLARPPLPLCATPPGSTPPGAGFYVPRIRLGGHGFATAANALSNAEDTCTDAVAILERNGDYAWVFPAEYADELIAGNPDVNRVDLDE